MMIDVGRAFVASWRRDVHACDRGTAWPMRHGDRMAAPAAAASPRASARTAERGLSSYADGSLRNADGDARRNGVDYMDDPS